MPAYVTSKSKLYVCGGSLVGLLLLTQAVLIKKKKELSMCMQIIVLR